MTLKLPEGFTEEERSRKAMTVVVVVVVTVATGFIGMIAYLIATG